MARLTRSLLFVPGSRPAMFAKAAASAADAVCLDLEDGVAPAEKAASRGAVVQALNAIDFGAKIRLVRINAIDTAFAYRDLVDVVEGAGARIDLIMLPKASSAHDVAFVDTLLSQIEAHVGLTRAIGIEAQIESASGFVHLREIGRASRRLEALVLGPGDYAASMRMPATAIGEPDANDALYPGHRYHAVMHELVAVARANGLRAIDGPYSAYRDAAGFERSCRIARAMGFDGKQCIHPSQLAPANTLFGPTADEVAAATAVVRAFEASIAAGHGAATHDGRMIDAASLRMARTILDRHERGQAGATQAN
jgi:citrate lyase subunit beta/citryl-CoA lyase